MKFNTLLVITLLGCTLTSNPFMGPGYEVHIAKPTYSKLTVFHWKYCGPLPQSAGHRAEIVAKNDPNLQRLCFPEYNKTLEFLREVIDTVMGIKSKQHGDTGVSEDNPLYLRTGYSDFDIAVAVENGGYYSSSTMTMSNGSGSTIKLVGTSNAKKADIQNKDGRIWYPGSIMNHVLEDDDRAGYCQFDFWTFRDGTIGDFEPLLRPNIFQSADRVADSSGNHVILKPIPDFSDTNNTEGVCNDLPDAKWIPIKTFITSWMRHPRYIYFEANTFHPTPIKPDLDDPANPDDLDALDLVDADGNAIDAKEYDVTVDQVENHDKTRTVGGGPTNAAIENEIPGTHFKCNCECGHHEDVNTQAILRVRNIPFGWYSTDGGLAGGKFMDDGNEYFHAAVPREGGHHKRKGKIHGFCKDGWVNFANCQQITMPATREYLSESCEAGFYSDYTKWCRKWAPMNDYYGRAVSCNKLAAVNEDVFYGTKSPKLRTWLYIEIEHWREFYDQLVEDNSVALRDSSDPTDQYGEHYTRTDQYAEAFHVLANHLIILMPNCPDPYIPILPKIDPCQISNTCHVHIGQECDKVTRWVKTLTTTHTLSHAYAQCFSVLLDDKEAYKIQQAMRWNCLKAGLPALTIYGENYNSGRKLHDTGYFEGERMGDDRVEAGRTEAEKALDALNFTNDADYQNLTPNDTTEPKQLDPATEFAETDTGPVAEQIPQESSGVKGQEWVGLESGAKG